MPTSDYKNDGLLPEEEPLFKEFQSYIRSISVEITRETAKRLNEAITEHKNSVVTLNTRANELIKTVDTTSTKFASELPKLLTSSLLETQNKHALALQVARIEYSETMTSLTSKLATSMDDHALVLMDVGEDTKRQLREIEQNLVVRQDKLATRIDNQAKALADVREDTKRQLREIEQNLVARQDRYFWIILVVMIMISLALILIPILNKHR